MKQLRCSKPGAFEYRQVETPGLKEGFALIKVLQVGICGTDLHAFDGTQPYFSYPRVLGHEIAGEVVKIADQSEIKEGDLIAVIPYFNCKACIACRRGKSNCCDKISVFGVHEDGGMQEYIQVPVSSIVKKAGLNLDQLALSEPLAIGLHAVKRSAIQQGDWVLVVGAGPIGVGIMEFARVRGAKVIMMDVNESRLQACKERFGAEFLVNALEEPSEKIAELTRGDFCTTVFDATGNLKAINGSLNYVSHGGEYILVGLQKENFSFKHPDFHKRETTLMSSRNATRDDFHEVLETLLEGRIQAEKFITHRIRFDQVGTDFDSLIDPQNQVIKAMIDF